MPFYVKQNDTSPAMLATLQDANGDAVNITGASVRFHMRPIGSNSITVDASATIVTHLKMVWLDMIGLRLTLIRLVHIKQSLR